MGKGRAPCCDKSQVKKGPWSSEEDLKLIAFIQKHGHENWRALPKQAGLLRCGKSCRLRWINYLRPDVKRGNFTPEEEETIIRLHKTLGNKWSKIASSLPGRTDNEIKNVWNTHLKKRLAFKTSDSSADESIKQESSLTSSSSSSSESFHSNETPNHTQTTPGNEFNDQPSQITMAEKKIEQNSEKQVSNELIGTTEDLKESSNSSLSSVESNALYSLEQQLSSPLEGEKQNHHDLIEIPWEQDHDFWKLLDNFGSLQSNETPNFGVESVQDAEANMWGHNDFENEFGVGEIKESNKDQFLPKNYATVQGMDTDIFDLDVMTRPESELDLSYVQLWPSWPQN